MSVSATEIHTPAMYVNVNKLANRISFSEESLREFAADIVERELTVAGWLQGQGDEITDSMILQRRRIVANEITERIRGGP